MLEDTHRMIVPTGSFDGILLKEPSAVAGVDTAPAWLGKMSGGCEEHFFVSEGPQR